HTMVQCNICVKSRDNPEYTQAPGRKNLEKAVFSVSFMTCRAPARLEIRKRLLERLHVAATIRRVARQLVDRVLEGRAAQDLERRLDAGLGQRLLVAHQEVAFGRQRHEVELEAP